MTISRSLVRAFSLVEVLIAIAILALVVVLLASVIGGVSRAWVAGEQQVQTFQDGRAVLDLISRELSQAAISSRLQLIQNPTLSLPPGMTQRVNSDSLFWQAPLTSTAAGNLSEVGYFLTDTFELRRMYIPPDSSDYRIYSNPPTATAAPWLPTSTQLETHSPVLATGVLGFWIRCFDLNGDLIPWFSTASPEAAGGTTIRYNSAARFQPPIAGQDAPGGNWPYTASSTAQAHRLPSAIDITLVTLDRRSFRRNPSIPGLPATANHFDVSNSIVSFNQQLIGARIPVARTFSARVRLINGAQ